MSMSLFIRMRAIAADGLVLFVESRDPETLAGREGRALARDLFSQGADVVALDLTAGRERWRTACDLQAIEHVLYGCAAEGKFVLVGSRNNGQDKERSRVVRCRIASTPVRCWIR